MKLMFENIFSDDEQLHNNATATASQQQKVILELRIDIWQLSEDSYLKIAQINLARLRVARNKI